MGQNPVNPLYATSVMGRGANHAEIGESVHRLEDSEDIGHLQHRTPDGQSHKGHRGTQRVPIYDKQGNLAGIRRVAINGTADSDHPMRKSSDGLDDRRSHRGNRDRRDRESDARLIGKSSDGPQHSGGHRGNR